MMSPGLESEATRVSHFRHTADKLFDGKLDSASIEETFKRWLSASSERGEWESYSAGAAARLQQMIVSRLPQTPSGRAVEDDLALLEVCPEYLSCRLVVVYEDERFVAVDKPWDYRIDLRAHDESSFQGEPVLADWFKARSDSTSVVRFCHQLDYGTSGVLLMAKDRQSCGAVGKRFVKRQVDKFYVSVLLGDLTAQLSTPLSSVQVAPAITPPIPQTALTSLLESISGHSPTAWDSDWFEVRLRLGETGSRMILDPDNGKECTTLVKILSHDRYTDGWLRRPGVSSNRDEPLAALPVTLVLFKPLTGRRHQLRVTAQALGCPILGDLKYGEKPDLSMASRTHRNAYRMYLHALSLQLETPWRPLSLCSVANCFSMSEQCFTLNAPEIVLTDVSAPAPPHGS